VVYSGRHSGVYDSWKACHEQVNRYKYNCFKGYDTREEAEHAYSKYLLQEERNQIRWSWMKNSFVLIVIFLSVMLVWSM
jgi:viroplasmin and RNaseH domain-containing protein